MLFSSPHPAPSLPTVQPFICSAARTWWWAPDRQGSCSDQPQMEGGERPSCKSDGEGSRHFGEGTRRGTDSRVGTSLLYAYMKEHISATLEEAGAGRHSWGQMQEPHPNQDPSLKNCKLGEKVFHLGESDELTRTVKWLLWLLWKQGILMCIHVCGCECVRVERGELWETTVWRPVLGVFRTKKSTRQKWRWLQRVAGWGWRGKSSGLNTSAGVGINQSTGLPRWFGGKEAAGQHRRCRVNPCGRDIPWRRAWQLAPVLLPGKSHGQRRLERFSPWGLRVRHDWVTKQR